MAHDPSVEPVALVTGFESFGKHSLNPSSLIAQRLDGATIEGHRVRGIELPVTTGGAPQVLIEAVERYRPDLVLAVGLAGGRNAVALERVAINVLDFSIPDNGGDQPFDRPIAADGPAAYFSSLPLKAILAAWRDAGIPGYVSNTAGTYLCNQIFYEAVHLAGRHGFRTGFIHVPCIPEQVAGMETPVPSMALELMVRAIETALQVSVTARRDVALAAGAVS